jgi:hypothetical protein
VEATHRHRVRATAQEQSQAVRATARSAWLLH